MIAKTYIFGGLSAFAALFLEILVNQSLQKVIITLPRLIEENLSVFIGFGVIEELVKFFFIYLVVRKSPYFDEPIDAMVYMVTGALGFAAAENLFLVFSGGQESIFLVILLRFVGATLLHALSSAIVGHYWARGIRFNIEGKFIFAGLVLASIFHIIFNYLVSEFNNFLVYPTAFLAILGFFVLYDFEELKKMG
ncbi:MAG: Protease PrsW [Candidatus Wolfebacteria bacterium GW2011_GWC1_43_10]|nr:MAG: Protease PrsW [Candidatus Wolfebacteria bacterium GW2011_GWC1_43_10]KKT22141.1 MAG: Protease PrsW [Parcubacteria group bacterium GW2011_GWB1_43_8b]